MGEPSRENRRAVRIRLDVPTLVTSVAQPEMNLPESLLRVYERVVADSAHVGLKFPGIVRDLSTNGAFIAGMPLPLLTRVNFSFSLADFGQVEAVAWTLWRRREDCEVAASDGSVVKLPKGFGVLFEAISVDARIAIHNVVTHAR